MKLNIKSFALTCSLLWGIGIFCLTWWIMLFDGPTKERAWLGKVYRGYNISPCGSVIRMLWGLVDALVGGASFACLYNALAEKYPMGGQERMKEMEG